jgi:hypothetical protein
MVFVGYGLHLYLSMGLVIVLCMTTALFYWDRTQTHTVPKTSMLGLAALGLLTLSPRVWDTTEWGLTRAIDPAGDTRFFFGRSGVVGVGADGSVYWDGLWHSELVQRPGDHIDTNNWWMAVAPVLAHSTGDIQHIGLIGLGTGITASSLAELGSVERIDAYEINHTLEQIFADFPQGTMGAASHPKIQILWEDARSGLALREQTYDVITTAPLYLRQAGAGLLNSKESYELIRSRLKPDGVVCVFSWGTDEQAFVVRQTAAEVFAYQESIWGGYLLLLSDSPIDLSPKTLEQRMRRHADDPLWAELIEFSGPLGADGLSTLLDDPSFDWGDGRWISTDDRPLVEYPRFLAQQLASTGQDRARIELPPPGQWSEDFDEQKWHAADGSIDVSGGMP